MQVDRKVLAGGITGLVATGLVWLAQRYAGFTLDVGLATVLVTTASSAVAYLVPPAAQDLLRHADQEVRNLGSTPPPLVVILALGAAVGLSACASRPQLSTVLCAFNNAGEMVLTGVIEAAVPAATPFLTLAELVADPIVAERCAAIGGAPLGVVAK